MLETNDQFSYFKTLSLSDQQALSQIPGWKWVASVGQGLASPITHPAHQRWNKTTANTHSPAHREIMLIIHGGGTYGHSGKIFRRTPGTVFLFNHYETRDWVSGPHNNMSSSSLWLHFTNPARKWFTYNTHSQDKEGRVYREITSRIYSGDSAHLIMEGWDRCQASPNDSMQWEYLKSLITFTLMEVLRVAQLKPPPNHQEQVVELVRQYIEDHFAEELNLPFLADVAGYSPFFFHRLFRSYIGKTPKEYLDGIRLARAQEFLMQGYTVSATAQSIGISSPYSFSRFFKDHMQVAPKIWLERNFPKP